MSDNTKDIKILHGVLSRFRSKLDYISATTAWYLADLGKALWVTTEN